jgi:hypothetical protein
MMETGEKLKPGDSGEEELGEGSVLDIIVDDRGRNEEFIGCEAWR